MELATPGAVEGADGGFDVSIVSVGQQPLQGDFVARPLARSAFMVCAAPAYLNRRGRPRHPDDLSSHDAVLPAVTALRRELTLIRQAADAGPANVVTLPTPSPALATAHLETVLAATLAGLGIGGLPSFMVDEALRQGRLEHLLPQWRGVTLTLHAAVPTHRHLPARTRAFIDFLVEAFGGGRHDPWWPAASVKSR